MLGFDVSTFIFQIINFLILLAILGRFFYRPVLNVMQQRQEKIDATIQAAEEKARQADEERDRLAKQSQAATREAAAVVESARSQAARERERMLHEAKAAAALIIDEARETASQEEEAALTSLADRLSRSAVTIAGSLIRETAGPSVHRDLLNRLLMNGLGLGEESLKEARLSVAENKSPLTVECAYPLDEAQRQLLRVQAAKVLAQPAETLTIEFQDAPSLLAGVRLTVGTLVVDLSLKHALDELSKTASDGAGD